jgi:deoxyribonuclease-4
MTQLLLGAHVSTAGGLHLAAARGREIGATAIQVFTKSPNQWREPKLDDAAVARFRESLKENGLLAVVSHDAYLINLASPDPALWRRSVAAFRNELERCSRLGIPYVVTHPGNFHDDPEAGLRRNAAAYQRCLAAVPGPAILIETTAGTGSALGWRFEELARLRQLVSEPWRRRVGFCADTCHIYAAGYDLAGDFDGVWEAWDRIIGLRHLRCLHLNDSRYPLGSRRDRHAWIGEGKLGPEPFRRIMRDQRFDPVIKIIETPKGDDPMRHDRRMLRRLKAYATLPRALQSGR